MSRHRVGARTASAAIHAALLAAPDTAPRLPPLLAESSEQDGSEPLRVTLLPAGSDPAAPPCPDYYVGVGYVASWGGTVSQVAPDGPAARAGLLAGDVVVNGDSIPRWSEPGRPVKLRVWRAGVEVTMVATTAYICYGSTP